MRPDPTRAAQTSGYLIALAAAAVLATTAIFIRYLTETYHLPALILAFWRDSFVALSLLAALSLLRPGWLRLPRAHLPFLLVYGLVLALFNSTWTLSVAVNGAAIATILVYCSTAFTAVLARWLLKESLDGAKLLAVALSLAGCVLVADALNQAAWHANPLGIVMGVVSGLCYAVYSLMGRAASQRGLETWTTLAYTFGFAACGLLVFNLLPSVLLLGNMPAGLLPGAAVRPTDLLWLGNAWLGWGILLALAAGPTLLGFGLYNMSLARLPSSVANLVVTLEPIFTAVLAYALLGERLTGTQIGGGLLILLGIVIIRLHEGRQLTGLAAEEPVAGD